MNRIMVNGATTPFWLLLWLACLLPALAQPPAWRFAEHYDARELRTDGQVGRAFVRDYLQAEAVFFALARDPDSGLSYDGWNLDPNTRQPITARSLSAASKECLDLAVCTKGLYGDPLLSQVISPRDPAEAPQVCAQILSQKLQSYRRFQDDYPQFRGYLTWFESGPSIRPLESWSQAIPTLDLGEMLWALLLAEKALQDTGHLELAQGYRDYNRQLQNHALELLYEPDSGGVRGHVEVTAAGFRGEGTIKGEHGVHESQMVLLYLTLFGELSKQQKDRIWSQVKMVRVEHRYGTSWQGFWGSPHEEWAYLFLPYRDIPGYRDLFRIREKIRTHNARARGRRGLAGSAHHPHQDLYMSAAGIEGINSQPLEYQNTYTPYGAFPLLLEFAGQYHHNPGLAWLHSMLAVPGLQGPMGAGESGDDSGRAAAVKTVDVSFTNLLALSGGLERETRELLQQRGLYKEFIARMHREYEESFGDRALREVADFAYPASAIVQR